MLLQPKRKFEGNTPSHFYPAWRTLCAICFVWCPYAIQVSATMLLQKQCWHSKTRNAQRPTKQRRAAGEEALALPSHCPPAILLNLEPGGGRAKEVPPLVISSQLDSQTVALLSIFPVIWRLEEGKGRKLSFHPGNFLKREESLTFGAERKGGGWGGGEQPVPKACVDGPCCALE